MYSDYSFYFDVPRPQRLSRLLIFVKWLLVFPHAIVLWAFGILASIALFVGWFAVLLLGRWPEGLWRIVYSYVRWSTRVGIYTGLLRDEYPPFGDGPYPMEFHLEYPERQSRLMLIGRWFLMIPLAFWLVIVGLWAIVLSFVAFFAILFTGNIPEGIFESLVGVFRYSLKVTLYQYVLTDTWPGFSFS